MSNISIQRAKKENHFVINQQSNRESLNRDQASLLKLLQDVAFAANESSSVDSAVQFALDAICNYMDWVVGHAYEVKTVDDAQSMSLWHLNDPVKYSAFQKASESHLLRSGVGMVGEVMATGKPAYWSDLSIEAGFQRHQEASQAGLKSAFAFPILISRNVVGILEFFSDRAVVPDSNTLSSIAQVGTLLGRVMERSLAQQELQRSEMRFRTIFEESILGIKLINLQGYILDSNQALADMLGYTRAELRGKSFTQVTDSRDVPETLQHFEDLINGRIPHFKMEKRYICKDGQRVWGRLAMSIVRNANGTPQFAIGMIEDISRRKEMERELKEVQRRLLESTEAERLRLAQDLHDGPIQDLYGVNFQLQQLEAELDGRASQEIAKEMRNSIQGVISMIRYTCGELRPPTLAPFGLEKAIRSHAEQFQQNHPEMTLHLELMHDGKTLPEDMRLAMFRNYQQLVSNVLRHAEATMLTIRLLLDEKTVTLEIEDNGCGFTIPDRWIDLARSGHLGLVGASERAEALGGKIEIRSSPGEGTLIRTVVPREA